MDWILDFWTQTPAASNRIKSEAFHAAARIGLDLDVVFAEHTLLFVCFTFIYAKSTGVGLLVSCWYWIPSGFEFKICKTRLDPGSIKSDSVHLQDLHHSWHAYIGMPCNSIAWCFGNQFPKLLKTRNFSLFHANVCLPIVTQTQFMHCIGHFMPRNAA